MSSTTTAVIYKGEDYPLRLTIKRKSGKLYDLTGATEITLRLKKSDGTLLQKKYSLAEVSIVSVLGGEILVNLSDTDTAALLEKDFQDFDVRVDKSALTRIAYFTRKLSVKKALA